MAFFFHDMYIQAIFCCKASFKNGTFERFSSFMHWRHVFSSANLILQNMRIDDLFFSWTDAKCLLLFVSKIAHKNCIEKVYLLYTRIDFMRSFKADLGICKKLYHKYYTLWLLSIMNWSKEGSRNQLLFWIKAFIELITFESVFFSFHWPICLSKFPWRVHEKKNNLKKKIYIFGYKMMWHC